jgi:hypothetical protein
LIRTDLVLQKAAREFCAAFSMVLAKSLIPKALLLHPSHLVCWERLHQRALSHMDADVHVLWI